MSVHWVAGVGAVPAATGVQVPTLPGRGCTPCRPPRSRCCSRRPARSSPTCTSPALVQAVPFACCVQTLPTQLNPVDAVGAGRAAGLAVRRAAHVRAARPRRPGRARAGGVAAARPTCSAPALHESIAARRCWPRTCGRRPRRRTARRARRWRRPRRRTGRADPAVGDVAAGPFAARHRARLARPGAGRRAAPPCAQIAELHSASAPQAAPSGFLPQLPLTQRVGRNAVGVRRAAGPARLPVGRALERRARLRARPRAAARAVARPGRRAHEADARLVRAHDAGVAAVARARAGAVADAGRPAAGGVLGRAAIARIGARERRQAGAFRAGVLAREAGVRRRPALQQTPSTHCADEHSDGVVHCSPSPFEGLSGPLSTYRSPDRHVRRPPCPARRRSCRPSPPPPHAPVAASATIERANCRAARTKATAIDEPFARGITACVPGSRAFRHPRTGEQRASLILRSQLSRNPLINALFS